MEVLEDQREWMREEEQRHEEGEHTTVETQHQQQLDHDDDNDVSAQSTPPPHEHHMHNATNDDVTYVTSPEPHIRLGSNADRTGPEDNNIKPLVCEPVVLGSTYGDWAEEAQEEIGYTLGGEHMPSN